MMTLAPKPNPPEAGLVTREFHNILDQQADIGVSNIIAAWFLDPPHSFDPNSRMTPKPEIVILLGYLLLMIAVSVGFDFW
jgi:hypothetical protein